MILGLTHVYHIFETVILVLDIGYISQEPPRYNWYIVESGINHNKTNQPTIYQAS